MLSAFSKDLVCVGPRGPQKKCDRREVKGAFTHRRDNRHLSVIICRRRSQGKEYLFFWCLCSSQHGGAV